ncbi:MAG: hypothetical protein JNM27_12440 [Leptospirales bacterium]|nr:hypothetical protein [Leptospirales bacterium]
MQLELRKPLTDGYNQMKGLLFRPFRAETWFTIGFSAFLIALGEGGGLNLPGNFLPESMKSKVGNGDPSALLEGVDWVGLGIGLGFLLVIFATGLTWVSSRGTFMFLDNLATGQAQIGGPWKQYAAQANSLFAWRMIVGSIALIGSVPLMVALLIGFIVRIAGSKATESFGELLSKLPASLQNPTNELLIGLSILFLIWIVFFILLNLVTHDFVVPFMYKRRVAVLAAWGSVWPVVSGIVGSIILYGLFKLVLRFAVGLGLILALALTCCLLAIPLVIPYIGTVCMLPVTATFQYFNLFYLRQLGPDFDVFTTALATPETGLYVPPEQRPPAGPADSENPYYPYKS